MQAPIRTATEELELTVRRLTVAYQRGLEDAYLKYAREMQRVFEGEEPLDLLAPPTIGSAPAAATSSHVDAPQATAAGGGPPLNEDR